MKWGNPVKRVLGRLNREGADIAQATQAEVAVEREEAQATADIEAFKGGLLAEDRLIRELGGLQTKKYTALKVVSAAHATLSKLSVGKRQLLGRLSVGRKRVGTLYSRVRLGVGGGAIIDPGYAQKVALWEQEQAKGLQLLAKETALAVQQEEQEAISVGPIIQVNKEIRAKLKEYDRLLLEEDRRLIDAVNMEVQEIKNSRDQYARERDALTAEVQNLRQQRGAGAPIR